MDYGAFPPEFNSARMYTGPGPESMLVAAAAWNALAAELRSTAASYETVVTGLTDGSWLGPSSAAMEAAAAPYVEWLNTTAVQTEMTAIQAQAAAGAYQTAFAMTVPPPLIAENRIQLMQLVMTNLLGQNTPAIATTEYQYGEMWAQDAAAMYTYAANSFAITSKVQPLTPAPETTNAAGLLAQGGSNAGNGASGGTQSALTQAINSLTQALQGLSSPSSSTSGTSTSGIAGLLSELLGGSAGSASTGVTTSAGPLGGLVDSSGIGTSVISQLMVMPAWAAVSSIGTFLSPLQTVMTQPITNALQPIAAAADAGAAEAAAGAADAAGAAGGFAGDVGGMAGLGQAASVGALAVPPSWGWAATAPAGMVGNLTLPGIDLGATGGASVAAGMPMMMGGLPAGAALAGAAGAAAGAARGKYLPRLNVVARSREAGYGDPAAAKSGAKYPVPATFPTNGHAPPGYQPAIVYLPANGQDAASTDK